jgi:hypothetical protein
MNASKSLKAGDRVMIVYPIGDNKLSHLMGVIYQDQIPCNPFVLARFPPYEPEFYLVSLLNPYLKPSCLKYPDDNTKA